MKNLLLFILLTYVTLIKAQGPLYEWTRSIGDSDDDRAVSVTNDSTGNSYIFGSFKYIVDFDPGPAVYNMVASPQEGFLLKLDPQGNFLWARKLPSINFMFTSTIKSDKAGNVYIPARAAMYSDLDPGPATYTVSVNGTSDACLYKFDTNGNLSWVNFFGGAGSDEGKFLDIDNAGNIYFSGSINGVVDMDQGPQTYTAGVPGQYSSFVSKIDAAGNFIWASIIPLGTGAISAIKVSASGDVYSTGCLKGIVDVDPGPATYTIGTNDNKYNIFVHKMNGSGNFLWARYFGEPYYDDYGYALTTDEFNNVYVCGQFTGPALDCDPGPAYNWITAPLGASVFILKLSAYGNFKWATNFQSTGVGLAKSILYHNGSIYSLLNIQGQIDVDPGPGTTNLASNGLEDIVICKLDTAGNYEWATIYGGSGSDYGSDISMDKTGSLMATGNYSLAVNFDFVSSSDTLTSIGKWDAFIHRLKDCSAPTPVYYLTPASNLTLCPGNSSTLTAISTGSITWYQTIAGINTSVGTGTMLITSPLSAGIHTFYTQAQNCNYGTPLTAITVTVELCTGIKDEELNNFSLHIFPNPSNAILNVEIKSQTAISKPHYRILNLAGQLLTEEEITSDHFTVNISGLPAGLYFFNLISDKGNKMVKIMRE